MKDKLDWTEDELQRYAKKYNISTEYINLYIEEFKDIFKNNFYFTPNQIRQAIEKILESSNVNALEYFERVYSQFARLQISKKDLTQEERLLRNRDARRIVDIAYELFNKNSQGIKDEFFASLKKIEENQINPYKIIYKGTIGIEGTFDVTKIENKNIREMIDFEENKLKLWKRYKNSVDILKNAFSDQLSDQEIKEMIERCSGLIVDLNKKRVENILSLLNDFFNTCDFIDDKYIPNFDFKNMIKRVPSLLTKSVDSIFNAMVFLQENYTNPKDPTTQLDLLKEVYKYPSLLMINSEKISLIENQLTKNGVENAHKFCYDIKNLINITNLTKGDIQNIDATKIVLKEFYGEKNANHLLTDFNVLSTEPETLRYILTKLTILDNQDNPDNSLRRKFLLENPSYLSVLQDEEIIMSSNNDSIDNIKDTIKTSKTKDFEEIGILKKTEKDLEKIKLSGKNYDKSEQIIDRIESKKHIDNKIIAQENGNAENAKILNKIEEKIQSDAPKSKLTEDMIKTIDHIENKEEFLPIKILKKLEVCLERDKEHRKDCKKLSREISFVLKKILRAQEILQDLVKNDYYKSIEKYDDLDLSKAIAKIPISQLKVLSPTEFKLATIPLRNLFKNFQNDMLWFINPYGTSDDGFNLEVTTYASLYCLYDLTKNIYPDDINRIVPEEQIKQMNNMMPIFLLCRPFCTLLLEKGFEIDKRIEKNQVNIKDENIDIETLNKKIQNQLNLSWKPIQAPILKMDHNEAVIKDVVNTQIRLMYEMVYGKRKRIFVPGEKYNFGKFECDEKGLYLIGKDNEEYIGNIFFPYESQKVFDFETAQKYGIPIHQKNSKNEDIVYNAEEELKNLTSKIASQYLNPTDPSGKNVTDDD